MSVKITEEHEKFLLSLADVEVTKSNDTRARLKTEIGERFLALMAENDKKKIAINQICESIGSLMDDKPGYKEALKQLVARSTPQGPSSDSAVTKLSFSFDRYEITCVKKGDDDQGDGVVATPVQQVIQVQQQKKAGGPAAEQQPEQQQAGGGEVVCAAALRSCLSAPPPSSLGKCILEGVQTRRAAARAHAAAVAAAEASEPPAVKKRKRAPEA